MYLPSGEEFAAFFHFSPIENDKIAASLPIAKLFEKPDFCRRTPLWYYLLREAALSTLAEPGPIDYGVPVRKLGEIGSRIIAETFYQVLMADSDSILNAGRHWQPPVFAFGGSNVGSPIDSLPAIASLLGSLD
jgi:hypothetical protein